MTRKTLCHSEIKTALIKFIAVFFISEGFKHNEDVALRRSSALPTMKSNNGE